MIKLLALIALLVPVVGSAEPLRVFVSVLPLKTFVEKIGGEHVRVQAMVRPGFNPHTYNPTPHQIAALSDAALYVRTGVPFEHAWMERIRSANREMQMLDARAGIEPRGLEEQDHDHGDAPSEHSADAAPGQGGRGSDASDPHIWTSPRLARQMVGKIRDKLVELDPEHESDYARNHAAFVAELDALDREIRALLADAPYRSFMVFHPAWGHFADTYGLVQVPIENEGKEPGPRALTGLIEQAKRQQVKVIFVQPQFSKKSAEQVASAIGGRVVAIDPLSPDYAGNLRRVARAIAEAMGQ
jgi:zinc transport system substrate-binding protein